MIELRLKSIITQINVKKRNVWHAHSKSAALFFLSRLSSAPFAKLVAATAAPLAVSVLVIHEVKRREARYEEMENSLQRHGERIDQVRSISALQELVADVERMLLAETYEWWVLAKANVAT